MRKFYVYTGHVWAAIAVGNGVIATVLPAEFDLTGMVTTVSILSGALAAYYWYRAGKV